MVRDAMRVRRDAMRARIPLVLTCEHGGNLLPAPYRRQASKSLQRELTTHRGYDIGALRVAKTLARLWGRPLTFSTISRLLIDLNRSLHHPGLMAAEIKAGLSAGDRAELIARYYTPHRLAVEAQIEAASRGRKPALHIAVHSFTPVLGGEVRKADIGLLYDPARQDEARFCHLWQRVIEEILPELRVRRNYPYRGNMDGMTTALRQKFAPARYLGIELEINNRLLQRSHQGEALARKLCATLEHAAAEFFALTQAKGF